MRTKLKNLLNGRVVDQTFRSGEKVEKPDLMEREMQYLYGKGTAFCMMDNESLRADHAHRGAGGRGVASISSKTSTSRSSSLIKRRWPWSCLTRGTGDSSDPNRGQGDTAAGGTKPATLESGATVQVPLFINEGDRVKVDTRTGAYIERVK